MTCPPDHPTLDQSLDYCHDLTRARAKNFYYGMKLVPQPKRAAMETLYAWMRVADDLADGPDTPEGPAASDSADRIAAIEEFRSLTVRVLDPDLPVSELPAGPIWPAFRHLTTSVPIPHQYFHDMIDGQLLDQQVTRYKSFDDLYQYCYKVASVVGLASIEIWGYSGGDETRKFAEHRGIAFQLTNILRDVLEDAQRDRVYLPADDFGVFQLNPVMFTLANPSEVLPGLVAVAQRAMHYYQLSQRLDALVDPGGRPCLWAMTAIYRSLLEKIIAHPASVLSPNRVRLNRLSKSIIALRALLKRGAA